MACRVRVLSACAALAIFMAGAPGVASAQDELAVLSLPPIPATANAQRYLLFNGIDIWRANVDLYGGMLWAPAGLNADGPIAQLFVSRRFDHYQDGSSTISKASVLGGYRVKRGDFELKVMVGPQWQQFDPTSSSAAQSGTKLGLHGVAETWWEPHPLFLLASSWTAYTFGHGYGARLAAGWRAFDQFWIGPEISTFSDVFSTQYRVGLHVTGLRWQDLEWSAATGHLEDNFHRRGGYLRFGVLLRH